MDNREDRIRARAYALWEKHGKPDGGEKDHWDEAERQLKQEESDPQIRSSPMDAGSVSETPDVVPPTRKKRSLSKTGKKSI